MFDIVLAIRLKKYSCRLKYYFFGERRIEEGPYLKGAMQSADDEDSDGSNKDDGTDEDMNDKEVKGENEDTREIFIQEKTMVDELAAQVKADKKGEDEWFMAPPRD